MATFSRSLRIFARNLNAIINGEKDGAARSGWLALGEAPRRLRIDAVRGLKRTCPRLGAAQLRFQNVEPESRRENAERRFSSPAIDTAKDDWGFMDC